MTTACFTCRRSSQLAPGGMVSMVPRPHRVIVQSYPNSLGPPPEFLDPQERAMHYRPLGRTGLSVSEIGFGAWGIGGSMWIGADEDESVRALHRAIELGVNFIDTARGYGESERIVGTVLREHTGDEVYVATKVPPKNGMWPAPSGVDPSETFPGSHIRQ